MEEFLSTHKSNLRNFFVDNTKSQIKIEDFDIQTTITHLKGYYEVVKKISPENLSDNNKIVIKYFEECSSIFTKIKEYDEAYQDSWNQPMPEKSIQDFESIISDLTYFPKDSESSSIVFKAKHNQNKCFIKSFTINRASLPLGKKDISALQLEYEQKLYRYIKSRTVQPNPYDVNSHFIEVYDFFKIPSKDFIPYLEQKNVIRSPDIIAQIYHGKLDATPDTKAELDARSEYVYFIITKEYDNYQTYYEFITKQNIDIVINTFFDLMYGIYLMNQILKFNHNDLHFNNIIVEILPNPVNQTYIIDGLQITRQVNYKIHIYDFDRGNLKSHNNLQLNNLKKYGIDTDLNMMRDVYNVIYGLHTYVSISHSHFILNIFGIAPNISYFCLSTYGNCLQPFDNTDHYAITILKKIFTYYYNILRVIESESHNYDSPKLNYSSIKRQPNYPIIPQYVSSVSSKDSNTLLEKQEPVAAAAAAAYPQISSNPSNPQSGGYSENAYKYLKYKIKNKKIE